MIAVIRELIEPQDFAVFIEDLQAEIVIILCSHTLIAQKIMIKVSLEWPENDLG
jgi:hypothetical protein